MKRTREQRQQDRDDLIAALRDHDGPMLTGELMETAYGVTEVQWGSPIHKAACLDLAYLERHQLIRRCWDGPFMAYALATDETRAADEDEAEVRRMMGQWTEA